MYESSYIVAPGNSTLATGLLERLEDPFIGLPWPFAMCPLAFGDGDSDNVGDLDWG